MHRYLAAALIALAAPAAAQDAPPIEDVASDAAFGFCPLFLAGRFGLDAPELAQRGFGTEVETAPDERFGQLSVVTTERDDGRMAFGGATGKICIVVVDGPHRADVLSALRDRKDWTGLAFEAVDAPDEAPDRNVETFRAAVEGQALYLQLFEAETSVPIVVAQLFAMDS
jgi:hypothetical protein